jgi:hypothetical protein
MNDTGSEILALFDTDMLSLGNLQGYTGWFEQAAIQSANGMIDIYSKIHVQVQMVGDDNLPWSDWIGEEAIVKPVGPGIPQLSCIQIRNFLVLATTPGNNFLAVSTTKGGLTSLL